MPDELGYVHDDYLSMISDLCDLEDDELNQWETEFIESLSNWQGDFTQSQKEKLHEIWERLI